MATDVLAAAAGQWPRLLIELAALAPEQLENRHQPCPACGGTDRYRWDRDDGPGGWFCNQCGGREQRGGGGSGMDLLLRLTGWDFATAARRIEAHLALPAQPAPHRPAPASPRHTRSGSKAGRPAAFPTPHRPLPRRRSWAAPAASGATPMRPERRCSGCSDWICCRAAGSARCSCSAPGWLGAGTSPPAAIRSAPTGLPPGRSTGWRS